MSLPPGFLDELRPRTSLAQVVGRKVLWDNRKSNQAKGDMWAPCPFHQEKTASFHVDDRKGFYYCFGCHAKGDAISFVRETENVDFMEAVEILAREAGLPMPARDPQAKEKADRNAELADVMEQAVRHFRLQLSTGAAAEARAYLARRGLDDAALSRFEIGFAPDARQGLYRHLRDKGVADDLIVEAGLCAKPDDGGAPYDRFRDRIVFPIRDPRGRAIALGGRAMSPQARAKYLNSPATPLFDKSRNLYNHAPAREAAGKGQPLVVAEGYMDVIALVTHGLEAAVAPLGTAITETQLGLLWRIADEPVVALDGDRAGLQAAYRLIDLALPLLEAGKGLRFALMPPGQDPDDLLRAQGPAALRKLLDEALPMVRLLWRRETEGRSLDSPERRAALDKALRAAVGRIRDPSIRTHYGEAFRSLRWELFRPARQGFGGRVRPGSGQRSLSPMSSTRQSLLVSAGDEVTGHLREAVILATLLAHPALIEEVAAPLEALECRDPDHDALRTALLARPDADAAELRAAIEATLGTEPLERLAATDHVAVTPCLRRPGDVELARQTLSEEFAKLDAIRGLQMEIREAEEDLAQVADETLTWRLGQAAEANHRATRIGHEDKVEYETGPNGARVSRAERDTLRALLDSIADSKGRK
ncbi:DNA primase [Rhodosalinus sp. FB01]|uniref:DNA primase n=1 Tax=Rhodosalinus sp. FB01 TaxID=3239194 RepID=UPI0035265680